MKKYADAVDYFTSIKREAQVQSVPADLKSLNKQPNPMAPTKPATPPPSGGMSFEPAVVKGKTPAQKANAPQKAIQTPTSAVQQGTKGMPTLQFEDDVETMMRRNEQLEGKKPYNPEGI